MVYFSNFQCRKGRETKIEHEPKETTISTFVVLFLFFSWLTPCKSNPNPLNAHEREGDREGERESWCSFSFLLKQENHLLSNMPCHAMPIKLFFVQFGYPSLSDCTLFISPPIPHSSGSISLFFYTLLPETNISELPPTNAKMKTKKQEKEEERKCSGHLLYL